MPKEENTSRASSVLTQKFVEEVQRMKSLLFKQYAPNITM